MHVITVLSICTVFHDLLDENIVFCTTYEIKTPKSQH